MPESLSFSQLLRPVGQMLESLEVESFSLKVEDDGVAVLAEKAEKQRTAQSAHPDISLKVSWQIFRRKKVDPPRDPQPSSGSLEIHYSREDIARLEAQGQEKRTGAPGSPEAHSLSQILRAVGAFVDQKQGRLIRVVKDGQEVSIEYESALKRPLTDKFTVASLYDYWVKMYLRRRERG